MDAFQNKTLSDPAAGDGGGALYELPLPDPGNLATRSLPDAASARTRTLCSTGPWSPPSMPPNKVIDIGQPVPEYSLISPADAIH